MSAAVGVTVSLGSEAAIGFDPRGAGPRETVLTVCDFSQNGCESFWACAKSYANNEFWSL